MELLDLTHKFTGHMPVYPGDPNPELIEIAKIPKDVCADHMLKTTMHVGTHMDAPAHMIAGGKNISDYDLLPYTRLIGTRDYLIDSYLQ